MDYRISFTQSDKNRLRDTHDETVISQLEEVIVKTNETLTWKNSLSGCSERFHSVLTGSPEYFAELNFTAQSTDYRAIIAWLPESEIFTVIYVVQKEQYYQTSEQKDVIAQIERHPRKIIQRAENQFQAVQGECHRA